jgi:hypothetical protein
MSLERHSASWALRTVLGPEARAFPEELFFGLGVGLWFRWEPGARRVSGLHPHAVQRALLGLNVTTMVFRHLDRGVLRLLAERGSEPTLVSLPQAGRAGCGAEDVGWCAPGTWVVVTRVVGRADEQDAVVEFVHPHEGPQSIPGPEFLARWMGGREGHRCAAWIVPLCVHLRFDLRLALRRAAWLFCEQMSAAFPTLGHCGLQGLEALAARCAHGDGLPFGASRTDGGARLYRDHMAAFLEFSAQALGRDDWRAPAESLRASAALWGEILRASVEPGTALVPPLRQALALEREAVAQLRQVNQWPLARALGFALGTPARSERLQHPRPELRLGGVRP